MPDLALTAEAIAVTRRRRRRSASSPAARARGVLSEDRAAGPDKRVSEIDTLAGVVEPHERRPGRSAAPAAVVETDRAR